MKPTSKRKDRARLRAIAKRCGKQIAAREKYEANYLRSAIADTHQMKKPPGCIRAALFLGKPEDS